MRDDIPIVGRVPSLEASVVRALYESPAPHESLRELLSANVALRAAIRLASPTLSAALNTWVSGGRPRNKHAPLRALGYVVRMATRCTPFGLFAAAGAVPAGEYTDLAVDTTQMPQPAARPDARWLLATAAALLRDPRHFGGARIVANDLAIERGDELYVFDAARASRTSGGAELPVWRYDTVHLRQNAAVRWLRTAAAEPIRIDDLVERAAARFGSSAQRMLGLVSTLLDAGVLAAVRPSLSGDALASLLALFEEHPAAERLGELRAELRALESGGTVGLTSQRIDAVDRALQARCPIEGNAFAVDLACEFAGGLGANVVADARTLAKVMLADGKSTRVEAYIDAFVERYESLDRAIPLLQLVHDDFVLTPGRPRESLPPAREALLADLAAGALRDGARELALDDRGFDRLFPGLRASGVGQTCEIGFTVCARDRAAIDAGDYLIVPTAGANSNGVAKSAVRLGGMLGAAFEERAADARCAQAPPDAVVADLDYLPLEARGGNIIARRPVHRYAIGDAATLPAAGVTRISPADILIAFEDGEFVAYATSLGRRIEIDESYLLETGYFAPPHMRFLAELANARKRTPQPFDWGRAAGTLPFLPRLRYGRVVLAVARWLIPREELGGDVAQRETTLTRWRTDWRLPRWVYLVERDVKLLIDLDSPVALELLWDQLPKVLGERVCFEEMLPGFDDLWLQRAGASVAHEFVATFAGTTLPESSAIRPMRPSCAPVRGLGPASAWVYVKLYACANELDALVRDIIPSIVDACGETVDRWFFLRYRDPQQHLRLRLHAAGGRGTPIVASVMEILEPLLHSGRLERYGFDTYRPEPERFGGDAALEPIEQLVCADSARTLEALALRSGDPSAVTALRSSVPLLRAWFATFDLARWLEAGARRRRDAGAIDYDFVRRIRGWLEETGAHATAAELRAVADLAALEAAGTLDRPTGRILGILLHLHFNRAGVRFESEARLEAHLRRALRGCAAKFGALPQPDAGLRRRLVSP